MADPITGALVSHLGAIIERQIRENIQLVVGVDTEIQKLKSTLISIQSVILDADNKQYKEHSINLWLQRLGDVCYDLDDVLADWSIALFIFQREKLENNIPNNKVCSFITFPCFSFRRIIRRRDIALNIKELNKRLDQINLERQNYTLNDIPSSNVGVVRHPTTSFVDESKIKGRDTEKTILVEELLKGREEGLNIVSIVGMGGMGKTTLAKFAYHSDEVKDHFEMTLWVVVSEPFDLVRIAKEIIEIIDGNKDPELFGLEAILNRLREKIKERRYLLVLDDAWTSDIEKWECLLSCLGFGASGSTILVTTRNEMVAKTICSTYIIPLGVLSDEDCWDLFSQYAFLVENLEHLKPIGRGISNKCKGLPLAAKTIGNSMRSKNTREDWNNVLNSDIWDLEETDDVKILPSLMLSYHALEEYACRRCFRYCAIFPKDTEIEAENLINLWMANGYLISKGKADTEDIGRKYLDNLAMRCFFQDLERDDDTNNIVRFKMHDMVHDLAQHLTKNECSTIEVVDSKSPPTEFRHLTLVTRKYVPLQCIQGDTTKLHTLLARFNDRNGTSVKLSPDFFTHLLHLKVLDVSHNNLEEVHNDIGKLLNLRYLNLSWNDLLKELPGTMCELYNLQTLNLSGNDLGVPNDIGKLLNLRYLNLSHNRLLKELPESFCKLYNLHTLNLDVCTNLERLPHGIGKLENLRHLKIEETSSLRKLPKGVGNLKFLQTLSKVILSSIEDDPGTFNLEDLKQLRGSIKTEELEMDSLSSQEVAEALEFHPDVKVLTLRRYGGAQLPNWILSLKNLRTYGGAQLPNRILSLNNLRILQLMDCSNCTFLPPLGKLQALEILEIKKMNTLKRIGEEFLGIEAYSDNGVIDIFPKLKILTFKYMLSWEEWDITSPAIMKGVEDGNLRIMPCLQYLTLKGCMKLKEVPPLGKLQALEFLYIRGMDSLKRIGEEFLGIEAYSDNGVIDIFPKLKSLNFEDMLSWEEWDITSPAIMKGVEDGNLRIMPCLLNMELYDCMKLKEVPEILLQSLEDRIMIINCPLLEQNMEDVI